MGDETVVGRGVPSGEDEFERGLNEIRLAVLGIIVAVGLAAAAIPDAWPSQLATGVGTFILACLLIRWKPSRGRLMDFMYWLTGR